MSDRANDRCFVCNGFRDGFLCHESCGREIEAENAALRADLARYKRTMYIVRSLTRALEEQPK